MNQGKQMAMSNKLWFTSLNAFLGLLAKRLQEKKML